VFTGNGRAAAWRGGAVGWWEPGRADKLLRKGDIQ